MRTAAGADENARIRIVRFSSHRLCIAPVRNRWQAASVAVGHSPFEESTMAGIYHIKDRRADRGRSEGVKVHDNSSLSKHSGSMVSHDQRNRVAREYRFRGTAPATNYCSAIELQDFANRIQEHWRAAHNAQHAPTTARGARHALQTGLPH
jgi:hypothetical protein